MSSNVIRFPGDISSIEVLESCIDKFENDYDYKGGHCFVILYNRDQDRFTTTWTDGMKESSLICALEKAKMIVFDEGH